MAFSVIWNPNLGATITLNGTAYPIDETFKIDVQFDDPSAPKFQRAGEWETFAYPGIATIICEGHILSTLNTNADFWTKRHTFLDSLTPEDKELTSRTHGRLTINDTDAAEPAYQDVRIINRVADLDSESPQRCPYMVTFKAFTPYFIGKRSGKKYILG